MLLFVLHMGLIVALHFPITQDTYFPLHFLYLDAITGISIRCVILSQILATRDTSSRRSLSEQGFTLDVEYELSSDETGVVDIIENTLNSPEFQAEAVTAIDMEVTSKLLFHHCLHFFDFCMPYYGSSAQVNISPLKTQYHVVMCTSQERYHH